MARKRSETKVVGKPGVGAVLADLMNERGLNPTEMGRRAQISRATVYVVLDSRSRNPGTMRQLAAGLAKRDEADEQGDPEVERAAARALLTAAGYGSLIVEYPSAPVELASGERSVDDLTDEEVADELERRLGGDREVAVSLLAAVNNWRNLGPRSRRLILETVRYAAGEDDDPSAPRRARE